MSKIIENEAIKLASVLKRPEVSELPFEQTAPDYSLEIGGFVEVTPNLNGKKLTPKDLKRVKSYVLPGQVAGIVKKINEDENGDEYVSYLIKGIANGKALITLSIKGEEFYSVIVAVGTGKNELVDNVVDLNNVRISFKVGGQERVIINHMNLGIRRGEIFGLIGESGSGKTTVGRAIIRVNYVSGGEIRYNGVKISGKVHKDVERALKTKMQMIFQDPAASLNDRANVDYIVSEGLRAFHLYENEADRLQKVETIIREVGLRPEHLKRYPHEFSGGQRQRIGIARCMVMNPEFVIADEPISALDVSIRAQVLNLIKDFQKRNDMTVMFIAHDLSVVKYISDRIGIIYQGKIVELCEANRLFALPLHPYTRSLLSAIPIPDPKVEKYKKVVTYNPWAHGYTENDIPELYEVEPGHFVRCDTRELAEYKRLVEEDKNGKKE